MSTKVYRNGLVLKFFACQCLGWQVPTHTSCQERSYGCNLLDRIGTIFRSCFQGQQLQAHNLKWQFHRIDPLKICYLGSYARKLSWKTEFWKNSRKNSDRTEAIWHFSVRKMPHKKNIVIFIFMCCTWIKWWQIKFRNWLWIFVHLFLLRFCFSNLMNFILCDVWWWKRFGGA